MGSKELNLKGNSTTLQIKRIGTDKILIRVIDQSATLLDRGQAHLLMLFLQEYLNGST